MTGADLRSWATRPIGPLAPLGWLLALIAVVVVFSVVANGLGFRWDPFNVAERRAERAESRAVAAEDNAAARTLESEGRADQLERVETVHRQIIEVQTVTAEAVAAARSAPDADTPLDPDRAARLRGHDRELCGLAPALGGCTATPAAADDRG